MKNSKLISVFKSGNMVIPLFMMQNFKKFDLEMELFVFLLYLYNLGEKFIFDPKKFSNDLGMEIGTVMSYISILGDKNYIKVDVVKDEKGLMEEMVLLDGFYKKITLITMDEVNTVLVDESTVFEFIEKEFGRTISPTEYEIIRAWIDNNHSEDIIREAVKEATFNGVSNLRYIDKILYEWDKKNIKTVEDVEKNRKRFRKEEKSSEVDTDIIDWDWFDDEE